MAEQELASTPHDLEKHEADYSNFIKMLKWGAIICFIVGMVWMLIIKAYW